MLSSSGITLILRFHTGAVTARLSLPVHLPVIDSLSNFGADFRFSLTVWADMATSLAGSVNVYEMDCDAPENKKVCRGEKVRAYPTLVL